jgi:hypothetical protein
MQGAMFHSDETIQVNKKQGQQVNKPLWLQNTTDLLEVLTRTNYYRYNSRMEETE